MTLLSKDVGSKVFVCLFVGGFFSFAVLPEGSFVLFFGFTTLNPQWRWKNLCTAKNPENSQNKSNEKAKKEACTRKKATKHLERVLFFSKKKETQIKTWEEVSTKKNN